MLKQFYPYEYAESVFAIDYEKLWQMGYRGLLFDIDNTLVHHGDDSTPEIDALFREIQAIGFKTLLLSNNEEKRINRFMQNITSYYIHDAEKPKPWGYLKAAEIMELDKNQCVVIGDQVFTDVFGANRVGMASILVRFIRLPGLKKTRQASSRGAGCASDLALAPSLYAATGRHPEENGDRFESTPPFQRHQSIVL